VIALKKTVVIGIDGSRLHFVAARKLLRGYEVSHWLTLDGFEQRDPLALRPSVEDFFRRARIDKTQVTVALPRSSVVLRTLQFPKAVLPNLSNILEYQVENFEPTERAGLSFGHHLVDRGDATGKLEVMLAMARRSEIDRWKKFFATLAIQPKAMVCATLGLARLAQMADAHARENNFVVGAGENEIEIIAVFSGKLRGAKRFEWAEAAARGERLVEELIRLRSELRVEEKDVHNVLVTGRSADRVLAELRSHASHWPLRPLRIPAALKTRLSPTEFHSLAPVVGTSIAALAKSELSSNLMEHGEIESQPRWVWAPTYALCGVALLLAGAGAVRPFAQQAQFLTQLDGEIRRLQPQVRQMERLETETNQWQTKVAVLEGAQGKDARNLEALRELSEVLPTTAWINEFAFRGDTIEISGVADNATALVPLLEASPVFQDVALASGLTRNQEGKELFRLRAKFKF
jgi:Tfp pilus assembly protein PilN